MHESPLLRVEIMEVSLGSKCPSKHLQTNHKRCGGLPHCFDALHKAFHVNKHKLWSKKSAELQKEPWWLEIVHVQLGN